jgi:hypothetical protein
MPNSIANRRNTPLRKFPINRFPFTPSTYPGQRPRFSFFFTRNGIYRLKPRKVDQFLLDRGVPRINQRYAILAYGSNACPGQLLCKTLTDVPVLYGRLTGAEAVYAKRITKRGGYVPATLARKRGSRMSWVTLLTAEQLATMDGSEGRPNVNALAEIPNVQFFLGNSPSAPLYAYVNIMDGVMTEKGKPVSLRSMRQQRARWIFPSTSSAEAAKWLDFIVIPDRNPPPSYSQVLSKHTGHGSAKRKT